MHLALVAILVPIFLVYGYQGNALRFALQFLEIIAFNYVGKRVPICTVEFNCNFDVGKPDVKLMVLKPIVIGVRFHLGSVVLDYRAIVDGLDIFKHFLLSFGYSCIWFVSPKTTIFFQLSLHNLVRIIIVLVSISFFLCLFCFFISFIVGLFDGTVFFNKRLPNYFLALFRR